MILQLGLKYRDLNYIQKVLRENFILNNIFNKQLRKIWKIPKFSTSNDHKY